MKLKYHFFNFAVFLLISSISANSQNLILNGSFENIEYEKNTQSQIEKAVPWLGQSGTILTSQKNTIFKNTTSNLMPADGNNFCGLALYYDKNGNILVGKFTNPLVFQHQYKLSFKYAPQKKHYDKTFKIDYCFSKNINPGGNAPFAFNEKLNCYNFLPNRSTTEWTLFEDTITSAGNENYIIIWHMGREDYDEIFNFYFDDFVLVSLPENEAIIKRKPAITHSKVFEFNINEKINFTNNNYELSSSFKDSLDQFVKIINVNTCTLIVHGYTDSVGTPESNNKLSMARGISVANYLVAKGIPENKISVLAHGESDPVNNNSTEIYRSLNRRVVIEVFCEE